MGIPGEVREEIPKRLGEAEHGVNEIFRTAVREGA